MPSSFPFTLAKDLVVNPKTDYLARIKPGIHDKQSLLREVSSKLQFPSSFQSPNWDGFNDWMGDLTWIPNRRILLVHEAVPHVPRRELLTWRSSLKRRRMWRGKNERCSSYSPKKREHSLMPSAASSIALEGQAHAPVLPR